MTTAYKFLPTISYGDMLVRISVSFGLGGLIGLQRELESHPAGLRTHLLVSLGATLFTLAGAYGFQDFSGLTTTFDPTRVAAQVVSGIGFLGGGAIVKSGLTIQGLTTAATLWVSAAIGVAAAANFWFGAIMITALCLIVLELLKRLEVLYWRKRNTHFLKIENIDEGTVGKIATLLTMNHVQILNIIRTKPDPETAKFTVLLHFLMPKSIRSTPLLMASIIQGVEGVSFTDLVFLDNHDCKHFLQKISDQIAVGPSPIEFGAKLHGSTMPDFSPPGVTDQEFSSKFVQDSQKIAKESKKNKLKKTIDPKGRRKIFKFSKSEAKLEKSDSHESM